MAGGISPFGGAIRGRPEVPDRRGHDGGAFREDLYHERDPPFPGSGVADLPGRGPGYHGYLESNPGVRGGAERPRLPEYLATYSGNLICIKDIDAVTR